VLIFESIFVHSIYNKLFFLIVLWVVRQGVDGEAVIQGGEAGEKEDKQQAKTGPHES